MSGDSRLTLRWPAVILAVVALLAVGAGTAYVLMRSTGQRTAGSVGQPAAPGGTAGSSGVRPSAGTPTSGEALPDVAVTLTAEAVERAGIRLAPATADTSGSSFRLPGVVEANGYKQVVVTPLVAGRVTRVFVQLGQSVRRGQAMAEIFSPELSEAETRYISARAELDAHERELQRTGKLVEIGAASRQELERLHAEHAAKLTAVDSARSRLELLGLPASAIAGLAPGKDAGAVTPVAAPIAGVVTDRNANAGLNVDSSSRLFTVVDLSTVWVVADLYEKDFSRVQVGSTATVTTKAYPDVLLQGRVSYIDPQVNATTRTAKVRIEMPNPREQLRLGMFADVNVEGAEQSSNARIPRTAVQNVDNRTVVYLADPKQPGRFIEREVHIGEPSGSHVDVVSGISPGDTVVADGSFFVRAERERLGLRRHPAATAGSTSAESSGMARPTTQEAKVLVTEQGYEPAKVTLKAGLNARITFVRTTDKTCGTEVVFPSLNIRRALPLNQPVAIEFTPRAGEVTFVCGMSMLRGTVVVE